MEQLAILDCRPVYQVIDRKEGLGQIGYIPSQADIDV